jgi:2-polyprenyl-6-methoxyphenol hydroxylase-like FAD-dependent oxidoreductase
MDTDVLVVGAGPTGLMLANQLVRHGVRVSIIDRHSGPSLQTRALGVQARTLEIYAHLGIAERAIELGTPATGAEMWARGRRAARVPLGEIARELSPYPFLLILGQDDNERLLGELLGRKGVSIQWNTELVGLTQGPDRVIARLKHADGTEREIAAAWLGGCDGARSTVREQSGIPFVGEPYEQVFFVADTVMRGPMVPGELNVYLWPQGFHLFFPMRGVDHWRLVGILPPELRGRDDVTLDDVAPSIQAEAGTGLTFLGCNWFSTYRIHHRRAQRFRDRRCFLMGDAAHIHSPVGAQGMNTGLQDAYNLAWKLALVVSGRANIALLETYESERIPVAEALLSTTDKGFALVVSRSKLAGLFRTQILPKMMATAMKLGRFQRLAFRTISQIGIRYPTSPLSHSLPGLPGGAPRAGEHFPWLRVKLAPTGPAEDLYDKLDDTRFNLIAVGQPALADGIAALGDLLLTHVIPADPANDRELEQAHIPRPSFYLLRPDCYIGLCGTLLDPSAVARYLGDRVKVAGS